jgi:bromodomain adjacent to zinc finger domain protein 1B
MDVDDDASTDSQGDQDEDNELEEPGDPECVVCGGDEGLAVCSECRDAYHYECHVPALRHAPRSTWRCQQCSSGINIQGGGRARKDRSKSALLRSGGSRSRRSGGSRVSSRSRRSGGSRRRRDYDEEDEEEDEEEPPRRSSGRSRSSTSK